MSFRIEFTPELLREKAAEFEKDANALQDVTKSIMTKVEELDIPHVGERAGVFRGTIEGKAQSLLQTEMILREFARFLEASAQNMEDMEKVKLVSESLFRY